MTDVVCFYVKTAFMFQKMKNKQIKNIKKNLKPQRNKETSYNSFDGRTVIPKLKL